MKNPFLLLKRKLNFISIIPVSDQLLYPSYAPPAPDSCSLLHVLTVAKRQLFNLFIVMTIIYRQISIYTNTADLDFLWKQLFMNKNK